MYGASDERPLLRPRVRWCHIELKQEQHFCFSKKKQKRFISCHVVLAVAGTGTVISFLAKYSINLVQSFQFRGEKSKPHID